MIQLLHDTGVHSEALQKEQDTFIKASQVLMWMRKDPLLVLQKFRPKLMVRINQYSGDDNHKVKCYKKSSSNKGVLVPLPFYKLKMLRKSELSLKYIQKHFGTF